jgi:predicted HTH domain antitoxin
MASVRLDVQVPEELVELLRASKLAPLGVDAQVRVALAIHLFVTGEASKGKAAELAGVDFLTFDETLRDLGMPAVAYGEAEYRDDRETVDRERRRRMTG